MQLDADEWLLELFHGPTLAFKDLALQLVGRLFDHVLTQRDERITVLVATSGDTGSAAISGLASCSRAEIVVLYPEGRVSEVQRRQMTTVAAANVHAVAVDGTFDDCQRIVKQLFGDADFRERVGLAAANSINWARVAAQVAYYAWATAALGGRGLAFSVPTGNFGNVLSGWVARACGMPLERLVIGSNANDILPRLVSGGRMEMRDVVPTLSPSMDIQVSSNLERLLFELYGRDPERTASELARFGESGTLTLAGGPLDALRELFEATSLDDARHARRDARGIRPQRHPARSPHGSRPGRGPCPHGRARHAARRARDRPSGQVPRGRRARDRRLARAAAGPRRPARAPGAIRARRARTRTPSSASSSDSRADARYAAVPASCAGRALLVLADRRLLQAQQPGQREHHERAEEHADGPEAGAREDAAGRQGGDRGTAGHEQVVRGGEHAALRGDVTSAITVVPGHEAGRPAEPEQEEERRDQRRRARDAAQPYAASAQTPTPSSVVRRRPTRSTSSPTG